MKSSSRQRKVLSRLAALCGLAVISGCTVSNQEAPPLAGPSGFAVALEMSAAPQVLPRDGSSTSLITVTARNADGSPRANQRLLLQPDFGTLAFTDALTAANGTVSVVYTAPDMNVPVDTATIRVTPVDAGDAANNTDFSSGSVRIKVVGPDVPVADFSSDAPKPILQVVTFNASASSLGGKPCASACSYAWDFGDGSSGSDLVVQHQFSNPGVFNVTLTVTSKVSGSSNVVTKPVVITVPQTTTAVFSSGPCVGGAINCKALMDISIPADGVEIVNRTWDFGDGSSPLVTTDQIVPHTFPTNPNTVTYNVRLRLTDNFGRITSTTQQVQVP